MQVAERNYVFTGALPLVLDFVNLHCLPRRDMMTEERLITLQELYKRAETLLDIVDSNMHDMGLEEEKKLAADNELLKAVRISLENIVSPRLQDQSQNLSIARQNSSYKRQNSSYATALNQVQMRALRAMGGNALDAIEGMEEGEERTLGLERGNSHASTQSRRKSFARSHKWSSFLFEPDEFERNVMAFLVYQRNVSEDISDKQMTDSFAEYITTNPEFLYRIVERVTRRDPSLLAHKRTTMIPAAKTLVIKSERPVTPRKHPRNLLNTMSSVGSGSMDGNVSEETLGERDADGERDARERRARTCSRQTPAASSSTNLTRTATSAPSCRISGCTTLLIRALHSASALQGSIRHCG